MEVVRKISNETLMLIVLCLTAFFVNNSALPTDVTEAKTIVTARSIVENGKWMSPTMNGQPRFDKPPLAAWVSAAIESARPGNISAQRSAAAVMATLWAFFFFGVARYMERRRGFAELATVVFLTCYNVIYFGRMVSRDIYGYAFMMGAIYFLLRMMFDERYYAHPHKWRWALLGGVMLGLSYLGNGIMPFYAMLLPFLLVLLALKRPRTSGKWLPLISMLVVAMLTTGWWLVYLCRDHPDAIPAVWRSELSSWAGGHVRPWYYYWRFFSEMGVWGIFTLAALAVPYWYRKVSTKRPYLIAIAWMASAIVLLSIRPQKNMTDLVTMTPPCALAVACLLYHFVEKRAKDKWAKGLFMFNGYLMALIVFLLPVFIYLRMANWSLLDFGTTVFINVLLFVIAIYLGVSTMRREVRGVVSGIVLLFVIIECFMLGAIGGLFENRHQRSIALLRDDDYLGKMALYHSKDEDVRIETVYEAGCDILPLDLTDSVAVKKALPCVVLTHQALAGDMPESIIGQVDTLHLGVFDNNRLSRHIKHYTPELVYHATLLR